MASQWHYHHEGKQFGPVSSTQLKELAANGGLDPTDHVWKEGLAEWAPAKSLKGLFPHTTPSPSAPLLMSSPPPFPRTASAPAPSSPPDVDAGVTSLGSRFKAAGQLTAKQAQRTKIAKVDLPSAYKVLGRLKYGEGAYRDEFPVLFSQLDGLAGELKNIARQAAGRPAAEGIAAKTKAAAASAKDIAQRKGTELRMSQAFSKLGKAIYGKHGDNSGPPESLVPITTARYQIDALDAHVAELSRSAPGQLLTPKRIAIAGTAAVVLVVLCMIFGRGPRSPKPAPQGPAANLGSNGAPDGKGQPLHKSNGAIEPSQDLPDVRGQDSEDYKRGHDAGSRWAGAVLAGYQYSLNRMTGAQRRSYLFGVVESFQPQLDKYGRDYVESQYRDRATGALELSPVTLQQKGYYDAASEAWKAFQEKNPSGE